MKFKKYKKGREKVANELYLKLVTEDEEVKLVVVDHKGDIETYLCNVSPEGLKLFAYVETEAPRNHIRITKE